MSKALSRASIVFLLIMSALFIFPPSVDAGCLCYKTDGESTPFDSDAECTTVCAALSGSGGGGTDTGTKQCTCTNGTIVGIDCKQTCDLEVMYNTDPTAEAVAGPATNSTKLITPTLNVSIPGFDTDDFKITKAGDYLNVEFLGAYISAGYNYLVGASILIAIIMVMIGGLQYAFAGGMGETGKAKKRIKDAVVGLILLLSVYLILWTTNPALLNFSTLALKTISYADLEAMADRAVEECGDIKGTVGVCTIQVLQTPSGWSDELKDVVNSVAVEKTMDPILIAAHLQKETRGTISYTKEQRGPCGEIGVSQFMPTTFESTVGQECCVTVAAKSTKTRDRLGPLCDDGAVEEWPPENKEIFNKCNTSICGNCQVAKETCAEYFDTSGPDGLKNAVSAAATLIGKNLANAKISDDYALAMCAYNGSGAAAAEYGKSVGEIYSEFCTKSGGTN